MRGEGRRAPLPPPAAEDPESPADDQQVEHREKPDLPRTSPRPGEPGDHHDGHDRPGVHAAAARAHCRAEDAGEP